MVDRLVEALDAEPRLGEVSRAPARSAPRGRRDAGRARRACRASPRAPARRWCPRASGARPPGAADEAGGPCHEVVQSPSTRSPVVTCRGESIPDRIAEQGSPAVRLACARSPGRTGRGSRETLTLKQAAERVGVTPATLKRWAETGVIPNLKGSTRVDAGGGLPRPDRRPDARARAQPRAHPPGRRSRAGSPTASSRSCSPTSASRGLSRTWPRRPDLEPALIERFWTGIGLPPAGLEHMSEDDAQRGPVRGVGARRGLPAGGLPPALPRLRAGAVPDRRRRGAALPPLRARAADARGGARASRWPRRWRGWRATCCRSPRRSWTTCTGASSSTSWSRTWSATWRWSWRTRTWTSAGCAWRSPSPTSPATRASPRRRARRRRCRTSSASWRA